MTIDTERLAASGVAAMIVCLVGLFVGVAVVALFTNGWYVGVGIFTFFAVWALFYKVVRVER